MNPPEKTLVLACSLEDTWLVRLLAKQGYSVVICNSGAAALSSALINEPDLFVIHGYALQDTTGYDLIEKIKEAFPNRKMRLMFMHNGQFFDEGHELGIKRDGNGIDASLSRYAPPEIFLSVLRKLAAMDTLISA